MSKKYNFGGVSLNTKVNLVGELWRLLRKSILRVIPLFSHLISSQRPQNVS